MKASRKEGKNPQIWERRTGNRYESRRAIRLTPLSATERRSAMDMPVTTTFTIEGYRIKEYKGVARGIIVRSPTIAQGIVGGLKNIIGGRIGAYTDMCEQARGQAYQLLVEHAWQMGANAIVGMRYDASEVVSKGSATEVLCYGTAVVIERT
jgi:uncharacterized protein YbjQ (UPF0145 family)